MLAANLVQKPRRVVARVDLDNELSRRVNGALQATLKEHKVKMIRESKLLSRLGEHKVIVVLGIANKKWHLWVYVFGPYGLFCPRVANEQDARARFEIYSSGTAQLPESWVEAEASIPQIRGPSPAVNSEESPR